MKQFHQWEEFLEVRTLHYTAISSRSNVVFSVMAQLTCNHIKVGVASQTLYFYTLLPNPLTDIVVTPFLNTVSDVQKVLTSVVSYVELCAHDICIVFYSVCMR